MCALFLSSWTKPSATCRRTTKRRKVFVLVVQPMIHVDISCVETTSAVSQGGELISKLISLSPLLMKQSNREAFPWAKQTTLPTANEKKHSFIFFPVVILVVVAVSATKNIVQTARQGKETALRSHFARSAAFSLAVAAPFRPHRRELLFPVGWTNKEERKVEERKRDQKRERKKKGRRAKRKRGTSGENQGGRKEATGNRGAYFGPLSWKRPGWVEPRWDSGASLRRQSPSSSQSRFSALSSSGAPYFTLLSRCLSLFAPMEDKKNRVPRFLFSLVLAGSSTLRKNLFFRVDFVSLPLFSARFSCLIR